MTCEALRLVATVNDGASAPVGLPGHAIAAAAPLAEVMAAANPRDLDLAVHQLRTVLDRIQRQTDPATGPDPRDAALAPVLWRMAVLDGAFEACLGIGFEQLARRVGRLIILHDLGPGRDAARCLVSTLVETGAFIAQPEARHDWSRALGPAGRN